MTKTKGIILKGLIVSVIISGLITFFMIIPLLINISSHFNISISEYCINVPVGITVDGSGNTYVIGRSKPYGQEDYDVLIVKYNSSGELLWNKTWDGSEYGTGAVIVSDSIGNTYITGGKMLLKYNSSGHLQWDTTWGLHISDGWGNRIIMDNLENIYIMSSTGGSSDVLLLKYDSNGTLQWYEILDDPINYLSCEGITTDGLGNIYITGTNHSTPSNTFIVKYNSFGDLQWKKIWGGSEYETGNAIVSDNSGNIYVTGRTRSYANNSQSYILKYNATGELQWYQLYIGDPYIASPYDIVLDTLGNIYTISYIQELSDADVFLSKYDSSGNVLWNCTWEKPGTDEYGTDLEFDNSENIYVIAPSQTSRDNWYDSEIVLLKYNSSGDLLWNKTWGVCEY